MYTLIELRETCGACPTQWEGKTACGKHFYLRYRHGRLQIELDGAPIFSKVLELEGDKKEALSDGCIDLPVALSITNMFTVSEECKIASVYNV